jgi:hypothetical protein
MKREKLQNGMEFLKKCHREKIMPNFTRCHHRLQTLIPIFILSDRPNDGIKLRKSKILVF